MLFRSGDQKNRLARVEVAHRPTSWGEIRVGVGQLQEDEGLFGSAASGAFDAGWSGRSSFVSVAGQARLNERLSAFATYTEGFSSIADSGGLLHDWSGVRSNAFGIGMIADGVFDDKDRASLTFAQPFRVYRAKATLTVPVDRDAAGNVVQASERVDLSPAGRETTISLGYARWLDEDTELASGLFVRLEPDHDTQAKPDVGGGLLLRMKR